VVRVGSNFYNNPAINLPPKSGFITVFDAATGFPAAIMLDNGYISDVRAGAAGALAAKYLAKPIVNQVAVIGTGTQAYTQLKALMKVRKIETVRVWSRSPLEADTYARRMVEDHDLNIQIATTLEAAITPADLIITATRSTEPLIEGQWLKPGVHITAIGSNAAYKQELYPNVLQRADIIFTDSIEQCIAAGETHHAIEAGAIDAAKIQGELSHLIAGKLDGRSHPDQITVADLTGLTSQDAVVATLAMEKALFYGLGQRIESGLVQRAVDREAEPSL